MLWRADSQGPPPHHHHRLFELTFLPGNIHSGELGINLAAVFQDAWLANVINIHYKSNGNLLLLPVYGEIKSKTTFY